MNVGGNPKPGLRRLTPVGEWRGRVRATESSAGFTIIETLIVLAVTAFLLIAALTLVSGRQAKTQFMVSAQNAQQQLQAIVNQAASGSFPENASFKCTGSAGTAPVITGGGTGQGSNYGCIFMGKAVQFYPQTGAGLFNVMSLAGNQRLNGKEITVANAAKPLDEAKPQVIDPITEYKKFGGGLKVNCMTYRKTGTVGSPNVCSGPKTGAVAFVLTQGAYNASNELNSGSVQLDLYAIKSTQVNQSYGNITSAINKIAGGGGADFDPADEVYICFDGSNSNQSALMTIGNDGSMTVTLSIKGTGTCS